MTWIVRKSELGLQEKKRVHSYPYHFNYKACKREWKDRQEQLIDKIRSL